MHVYLGSDHAGFNLKNLLKEYLESQNDPKAETEKYHVVDLGVFTNDPSDYPDIAREVCEKVFENKDSFGILICGSGIGMSIAANRRTGIRAVLANNEITARMGRMHNNANVLCMGERFTGVELVKAITDVFLATSFDTAERHVRRVNKIEEMLKGKQPTEDTGNC